MSVMDFDPPSLRFMADKTKRMHLYVDPETWTAMALASDEVTLRKMIHEEVVNG